MVGAHERNTHVSIAVARGGLVSNGATAILYQFERCAHLRQRDLALWTAAVMTLAAFSFSRIAAGPA